MVIGRGRHREHPQPTFCTTKKKGPLPVTSLSSKGPTRADIVHTNKLFGIKCQRNIKFHAIRTKN
jgi:hypothetical protein